jgi:hypothetical protein
MAAEVKAYEERIRQVTIEMAQAVINVLRQQSPGPVRGEECSTAPGYCTVDGQSRAMSECDCRTVSNCSNWHRSALPTGSVDWSPNLTYPPPGAWVPATAIFGQLCQILSEIYATRMTVYMANEEVIKRLGYLINDANQDGGNGVGICTLDLTCPPINVRMTQAQCNTLQGGTWRAR